MRPRCTGPHAGAAFDRAEPAGAEGGYPPCDLTHGHLLGGRVRYAQPAEGFRSGIEPVLLAAAVPATAGERVVEAGSGAGAALLCLAARVGGITGLGVERDPALACLAERNAAANGMTGLRFLAASLEEMAGEGGFHHALANPPYHEPDGTRSAVVGREAAKRGGSALVAVWVACLAGLLRRRGTLTLVVPPNVLNALLAAMVRSDCPAVAIHPLWPKAGRAARLVLVRGVKGGRSPLRLLPGLVLHGADGRFTPDAEAVLRSGAALDLG